MLCVNIPSVIMLSVVMLFDNIPSVIMLRVVMLCLVLVVPNVYILGLVMPSVIILSVAVVML